MTLEKLKESAPAPADQKNPHVIDVVNDPDLYVPTALKKAKKVSVIIGEEFIQSGTDTDAVLAFCDFIGKDLLKSVFVINEQVNYMGAVVNGYVRNGYTFQRLTEELNSGAVKVVINAGFNAKPNCEIPDKLVKAFSKAETYIMTDIFKTGSIATADIILPAKIRWRLSAHLQLWTDVLLPLTKLSKPKGHRKTMWR